MGIAFAHRTRADRIRVGLSVFRAVHGAGCSVARVPQILRGPFVVRVESHQRWRRRRRTADRRRRPTRGPRRRPGGRKVQGTLKNINFLKAPPKRRD